MAAKYDSGVGEIAAGMAGLSLGVNVLSWNINGKTHSGMADVRHRTIPSVIKRIHPDVMLLQETKKSIMQWVKHIGNGTYKCEKAGDEEESQVLYDEKTFEKVSTSNVNQLVDNILVEMFPAEQTRRLRSNEVPERQVVKNRTCVVHLRHKSTNREFVFVSYHNIRKGGGKGVVKDWVSRFCQLIAKIHKLSKCNVIAGVDFNCGGFNHAELVTVPDYDATQRRSCKQKVDFFILNTEFKMDHSVRAFDLLTFVGYDMKKDADEALDHDPLIFHIS